MTDSPRALLKAALPTPVRRLLRGCLHYTQRVLRWPVILWQVRGATWSDEWTLIRSALAAPYLSLHSPLRWQDPILLADASVVVPGIGRFELRRRCDDLWHVLPWREPDILRVMREHVRAGDNFIDAGANIGVYTVLAARLVGSSGRVVCVEMMPDTAARLQQHIDLNALDNVILVRNALSDRGGQVLTATVEKGKYGQASIAKDRSGTKATSIEVTTATLDQVADSLHQVKMMKMDLEGAELAALHGAPRLLARVEHVVFESWGVQHQQGDPVVDFMRAAGFLVNRLDGNNQLATRALR